MSNHTNHVALGDLLEPETIAARLHCKGKSRAAFWAMVHREGIPIVRVTARRILFPALAFEAWLEARSNLHQP